MAHALETGLLAEPPLVLLHEVAHCLTPVTFASHGPEYAGVLLALARRGMGPGTAQLLEDAFARERVRWMLAAVPDVRAGWPSVANSRQTAAWAMTPGAIVGDGPAASLAAAHQRDTVDIVGHRDV